MEPTVLVAKVAAAAAEEGFHRHRAAIRGGAGQLMAQHSALNDALLDHMKVRATNGDGSDLDQHTAALWLFDVDQSRLAFLDANSSQGLGSPLRVGGAYASEFVAISRSSTISPPIKWLWMIRSRFSRSQFRYQAPSG